MHLVFFQDVHIHADYIPSFFFFFEITHLPDNNFYLSGTLPMKKHILFFPSQNSVRKVVLILIIILILQ